MLAFDLIGDLETRTGLAVSLGLLALLHPTWHYFLRYRSPGRRVLVRDSHKPWWWSWLLIAAVVTLPLAPSWAWPAPKALVLMGLVIELAGLGLASWGRQTLGWLWSPHVEVCEGHYWVVDGPYAHLAHPIYVGEILVAAGAAMVVAHPFALVLLLGLIILFRDKAVRERRLLAQHVGPDPRRRSDTGADRPQPRRDPATTRPAPARA